LGRLKQNFDEMKNPQPKLRVSFTRDSEMLLLHQSHDPTRGDHSAEEQGETVSAVANHFPWGIALRDSEYD
jgi:hypothetical protein